MSYADNKRIAKNTIYLYIRTFVSMIVALYTSRKILEALGVDDFGIFNVVGGIISLMSFINGSMSVATQRYLTYELGRGTEGQFNKVFNMAVYIHAIIAVIVLIAAETMGVWFVNTQLNIPEVRMEAANWVFQATILTTILGILQTPYNAAIISHEHMHIYAYVGLGETLAKLFIVWGLFYYPYDRLSIWGFAIFLLQFLIAMIYRMYCSRQFPECRLHLRWNKAIFNSMVQFTGWNMFGTIAWLLKDQGINILMNLFGGPVANAARGVSCQVSGAIQNLTGGFQSAVNPQLTKRYAAHESEETCDLMCKKLKNLLFFAFYHCIASHDGDRLHFGFVVSRSPPHDCFVYAHHYYRSLIKCLWRSHDNFAHGNRKYKMVSNCSQFIIAIHYSCGLFVVEKWLFH